MQRVRVRVRGGPKGGGRSHNHALFGVPGFAITCIVQGSKRGVDRENMHFPGSMRGFVCEGMLAGDVLGVCVTILNIGE